MTFNELSEAFNQLRNAALGRGVKPNVSDALARDVAIAWDGFRRWLADQGVIEDAVATSLVAREWIATHRTLAARVRAEGQEVPELPESPIEVVQNVATGIGKAAVIVLGAGVALAIGILAARSSNR